VGSFIRIGPGIEEGEPSSCGGAPRGVVLGGHKILSPPCVLRSQNLPYYVLRIRHHYTSKCIICGLEVSFPGSIAVIFLLRSRNIIDMQKRMQKCETYVKRPKSETS
jgi:hypothetical protein